MRVYIAGPMRGLPNWNFDAFDEAETRWRSAGHHPFSPAAIVRGMGYDWGESAPAEPDTLTGNAHLRHVLLSDVACILAADAIALLRGWEASRGATFEVALGQFLGLPFFDAVTMIRIYPTMRPWTLAETAVEQYLRRTATACEVPTYSTPIRPRGERIATEKRKCPPPCNGRGGWEDADEGQWVTHKDCNGTGYVDMLSLSAEEAAKRLAQVIRTL